VSTLFKRCQRFGNVLWTFGKLFVSTFWKRSQGAYVMHRWNALDKTFPTTPHMMGYLVDLKNVPAGHITVTGSISCTSLESSWQDLSNDTSHDGAMQLTFSWPLTVDLKGPSDFDKKTSFNRFRILSDECRKQISKILNR
jgi:hypothetical protein